LKGFYYSSYYNPSMATEFQKQVWREIDKIPAGSIATYSDIAERIGRPKAVRAVATAVGKNPNPISTPCHRVLPKSGGIGKYSGPGGIAKKRELLKKEGLEI